MEISEEIRYCKNECGNEVKAGRTFCSVRCGTIWRNKNDENLKQLSRERITKRNKTPEQIKYSIKNIMKVNNNIELRKEITNKFIELNKDPEFIRKNSISASNTLRKINEFKRTHNGRTYYEELLWKDKKFQQLNPLWNIKVRNTNITDYHSYYQLDFSIPHIKLNIELDDYNDGLLGHNSEADKIRDQYLTSLGWIILRFSNKKLDNIEEVVDEIYSVFNSLSVVMIK